MTICMTTPLLNPDILTFLRALASETRQAILILFMEHSALTVGEIAAAAGIGQSTASEHLAVLKRAGVLTSHREGKEVIYRPDRAHMLAYTQQLSDYLTSCCPPEQCDPS